MNSPELTAEPLLLDAVEAWRLGQLLEAGYPVDIGERLAVAHEVDLHQAIELHRRGCSAELAAAILL